MIHFRLFSHMIILLIGVLLIFPSCKTTRFEVYKLNPDTKTEGKEFGIPINLTKPQFYINEKLPSLNNQNMSLEVEVEYVPDTENRYSLSIDPALFNEIDFKLLLGDLGQLNQVNMANREKFTDTISTIGEIIVGIVGVMTKGAAIPIPVDGTEFFQEKSQKYEPKFIKLINENSEKIWAFDNNYRDLFKNKKPKNQEISWDFHPIDEGGIEKKTWENLELRIKKNRTAKELFATIYPKNRIEKRWLQTAYHRIADFLKKSQEKLKTKKKEYQDILKKIDASKTNADIEENIMVATIIKNSTFFWLVKKISLFVQLFPIEKEIIDLKKLIPILSEEKAGLDKINKLTDTEWRYRHVTHLEEEIERLNRKKITEKLLKNESKYLKKLEKRWNQTVRVTVERDRICTLKKTLKKIAENETKHRVRPIRETPPMEDYKIVRDEINQLSKIIMEKRASLSPKTKTPPPAFRAIPEVIWLSEKKDVPSEMSIDAVSRLYRENYGLNSWSSLSKAPKTPEFLLIIQRKGEQK